MPTLIRILQRYKKKCHYSQIKPAKHCLTINKDYTITIIHA